MNAIFLTGTDTGVGKTWVCAALIRALRGAGRSVGAYKPVCSGAETSPEGVVHWADLEALRGALDRPEVSIEAICPQRFLAPLAPPLAAEREARTVDRSLLTAGLERWRGEAEIVVVEGVGGILCPIAADATLAEIAAEWRLPTVVVAANRLGTINHTLLTIEALRAREIPLLGFVLNDASAEADPGSRKDHIAEIERHGRTRCLAVMGWNQATIPLDWLDG